MPHKYLSISIIYINWIEITCMIGSATCEAFNERSGDGQTSLADIDIYLSIVEYISIF